MKHRLWECSQGKLTTRQSFPDEEFARESEGMAATHGMYSWAQQPHCRGHRADSHAHTVPFRTRMTSSSTAHSASVSILQGELGRRVLGEPSVTVVATASWRARGQALSHGAGEAPPPPQLRGATPDRAPRVSCLCSARRRWMMSRGSAGVSTHGAGRRSRGPWRSEATPTAVSILADRAASSCAVVRHPPPPPKYLST